MCSINHQYSGISDRKDFMQRPQTAEVQNFPEIVFGLVGAVGTDLNRIKRLVCSSLNRKIKPLDPRLALPEIRIIDSLRLGRSFLTAGEIEEDIVVERSYTGIPASLQNSIRKILKSWPSSEISDAGVQRYINMLAGDIYRRRLSEKLEGVSSDKPDYSALALLAMSEIQKRREVILQERHKEEEFYAMNTAFILHSLKHPDEVTALRAVYGGAFILVGVYKDEADRAKFLQKRLEEQDCDKQHLGDIVEYFIRRDQKDASKEYGQNVRDTFPLADLFVDEKQNDEEIGNEIDRFVELLFSDPRHTPTRDEYAMFHAYATSVRSSAPGRQVGAAITNKDGEIIALGTNEVAKPGGGHYWFGETPDKRVITETYDSNAHEKKNITTDLYEKLKDFFKEEVSPEAVFSRIEKSKVANITEFDQTVHAEMSALSVAARENISIRGATLYCTAFPCHLCAKNIIAAGITKVVYVEPYPKSKAPELYPDAFGKHTNSEFTVSPFLGIGFRFYIELFSVFTSYGREIKRKDSSGKVICAPEIRLRLATRALSHYEMEQLYLTPIEGTISELSAVLSDC